MDFEFVNGVFAFAQHIEDALCFFAFGFDFGAAALVGFADALFLFVGVFDEQPFFFAIAVEIDLPTLVTKELFADRFVCGDELFEDLKWWGLALSTLCLSR